MSPSKGCTRAEDQVTGPTPLDGNLTSLHWLPEFLHPQHADWCAPDCHPSATPLPQTLLPRGTDSPSTLGRRHRRHPGSCLYLRSPMPPAFDSHTIARFASASTSGYRIPRKASPPVEVDHKTNPKVKPPYSCILTICMAMQAASSPK
ncbi:forkhead box protein J1-B-like protein [Lates japonicus]|uniref:Forkhead box protein J1-B-like protein n=1 Tax=Lates japonicus TaxID=270547 RepID=A0AAD3NPG6_LATJO|nr:forkhead box protein J1-B-like protein [Lates japonicus]